MFLFCPKGNNISLLKVVSERGLKNNNLKEGAGLVQYGIWFYLCRPVRKKAEEKVGELGTKKKVH